MKTLTEDTTMKTPIAYGNGTAGGIYHTQCWYDYADQHFKDCRARAFLGTVYYRSRDLKGQICEYCKKSFVTPEEKARIMKK